MEPAEIPYSTTMDQTYENFVADCPHCGMRNTFNRASDLQTFEPINFSAVTCQSPACQRPFNINNDTVNAPHELLLFDCCAFLDRKDYRQCVLNTAQAYEVFFNHFIYVQLIYRAYAHEGNYNLPHLNRLLQQLFDHIQRSTFKPMRRLFLRLLVGGAVPRSLAEAGVAIEHLPNSAEPPKDAPDPLRQDIKDMPDEPLGALLLRLLNTDVDERRNRVIHKQAHRPTREEATHAHREAREILFGLTGRLRLGHDPNWYIGQAGR